MDGEGEAGGGDGEECRGEEGEAIGRDVGGSVLPPAWAEPTPIKTVERMATPVALPTWRMVLKKVEARPIDSGEIMANDAAWFGTITCAIIQPSTNIRPSDQPQVGGHADLGQDQHDSGESDEPAGDVAPRTDAGVDETAGELRADHDPERLGKGRQS